MVNNQALHLLTFRTVSIKPQQPDALVEYGNLLQFKQVKVSHADRMYRFEGNLLPCSGRQFSTDAASQDESGM